MHDDALAGRGGARLLLQPWGPLFAEVSIHQCASGRWDTGAEERSERVLWETAHAQAGGVTQQMTKRDAIGLMDPTRGVIGRSTAIRR